MNTIDTIQITIPKITIELPYFKKLLALCDNQKSTDNTLIETTLDPTLKPTTTFIIQKTNDPQISFVGAGLDKSSFWIGKLPLGFNVGKPVADSKPAKKPVIINKIDTTGEYLQVKWPFASYNQLNFRQLHDRLVGKVVSLDHVGVNISPRLMTKANYNKVKTKVANSSFLVDYPSGEEWPFIIPATQTEQETKIKISKNRDPKFEFVYDFAYSYPELQLDIQTKLTAAETRALFPPPYGYHDPDPVAGCYCSRVFVYTGWKNVSLRIDLRYYLPGFSSADWLIQEGKRVLKVD